MATDLHGSSNKPHRGADHLTAAEREEERKQRLRTTKRLATGLLVAMAAIFVATLFVKDPGFAVLLIRSGAEAGVVGGLADWFAVTALFHRPLGLPIPHTAIIPNSKDRIGQALSHFVEENFLTREILVRRLEKAGLGRRLAAWLAEPRAASLVAGQVALAIPALLRSLENKDLRDFLERALGERLRNADVAPALGHLMRALTTSEQADALFDVIAEAARRWLAENEGKIARLVQDHSRWWIPKTVDVRVAKAVMDGLGDLLADLSQRDSGVRRNLKQDLARLIEATASSPERRDQLNGALQRLLQLPELQAWLDAVWSDLSRSVIRDLEQPSSPIRQALQRAVASFGRSISGDPVMVAHIENAVKHLALNVVVRRREIAGVIEEVVRSWDAQTVSRRLELAVGSDLQYIRMNGTIVGAGVGCLIYLASLLVETLL